MAWQEEITVVIRSLINDWCEPGSNPTYSDYRIQQLSVVAAQYVLQEVNINNTYVVDVVNIEITPDPTAPESRDNDFISFIGLKAACMLDQSTFRTKAASEGLRAALGPASLSVSGTLGGYKDIINMGPCKLYDQLVLDYNIGNASAVRAIFSPFVGNGFDPQNLTSPDNLHSRNKSNQFF